MQQNTSGIGIFPCFFYVSIQNLNILFPKSYCFFYCIALQYTLLALNKKEC